MASPGRTVARWFAGRLSRLDGHDRAWRNALTAMSTLEREHRDRDAAYAAMDDAVDRHADGRTLVDHR